MKPADADSAARPLRLLDVTFPARAAIMHTMHAGATTAAVGRALEGAGRLAHALPWCSLSGALLVLGLVPSAAGEPPVTISGGVDPENRHAYAWTVTNHGASPIVFIEFPHYHGDTFLTPEGWSQEWKNQAKVGGEDAPGWVRATPATSAEGVRTGQSVTMRMRIARAGALARPGRVAVRFADGSEFVVTGVELPTAPSFFEQNIMLFGLAVIFIAVLLIQLRRRRRRAAAGGESASPAGGA